MTTTLKGMGFVRMAAGWLQVGLVASLLTVAGVAQAAGTLTVTPDADAFVQSGNPTNNYGTNSKLRFRDNGSEVRMSYLRFTLPSIASGNVVSAKLRLMTSAISGVDVPVGVYSVADTSWGEGAITWNNKPAMSGTALATALANDNPVRWVEWDITNYVRAELAAGRSLISLGVKRTSTGSQDGEFQSRENGQAERIPQLVIIEGATGSAALTAVADSSVRQQDPTSNYGTSGSLEIDATPYEKRAFLKFDLSSISTLGGVKLRMNGYVTSGTTMIAVYPVSDTSWGETTITWNNQPSAGPTALATVSVVGSTNAWYEWDVGAYAQAEKTAGHNVIAFVLKQTGAGTNDVFFNSREASSGMPYLLVSPPSMSAYYIHTDHLNTPRAVTNNVGQAVWTWANDDPFGNNVPNENPSGAGNFTCNLRLPGQYFDKETNLHYNYFRDFDPPTGRYIQPDPIGIVTTLPPTPTTGLNHLYGYVLNNPLGGIDPLGLLTILGCTPAQTRQLEIAAGKASAAANSPCVACEDRSNLKRRIDDLVIQCTTYSTTIGPSGREVRFCGGVRRGDPTVFISPLAFTDKRCGCLQATVIHEAAHTLSSPYTDDPNDPRNANNLARRCFKCAP